MALMCPFGGECIHSDEMKEYVSSHGRTATDEGTVPLRHIDECRRVNCIQLERNKTSLDKHEDDNLEMKEYAK